MDVRVCFQVRDFLEPLCLSQEKLQDVSARLKKAMQRGLNKHTHHKAAVKMLPTFVRATPDGTGEAGSVHGLKHGHTGQEVSVGVGLTFFSCCGREGRLPGVGSRRNKLPRSSRARDGGGEEGAEDGQSGLRHPTGDDGGAWRTGEEPLDAKAGHLSREDTRKVSG